MCILVFLRIVRMYEMADLSLISSIINASGSQEYRICVISLHVYTRQKKNAYISVYLFRVMLFNQ